MIRNSCDYGKATTTFRSPTIWEASNGPLFIRSVWMDRQGYRHFLLNRDSHHHHHNHHHDHNKTKINSKRSKTQKLKPTLESWNADASTSSNVTADNRKYGKQPVAALRRQSIRSKVELLQRVTENSKNVKKQKVSKSSELGNTLKRSDSESIVFSSEETYQLTERVLQWLDLAGKTPITLEEAHCDVLVANQDNNKRRILTAIPNYKPRPTPKLKRIESIHHLSITLNEDDLVNSIPARRDSQPNTFQLSYLCGARKLRQMSSNKPNGVAVASKHPPNSTARNDNPASVANNSTPTLSPKSNASAGAPLAGPRLGKSTKQQQQHRKGKLIKTDSIENQYRSMIHRQLLETSCNTQFAKRQLHIFMPNIPPNKAQQPSSQTSHTQRLGRVDGGASIASTDC